MATTADIGGGGCASDDDAPRVRPLRRLCWSCGDLLAVEPPREGLLATLCSARCPRCTAVTTALVPPTAAPPFPGLYERPAPLKLALRRVKRLLKRRRTPASTAERTHAGGPRYLVEWEEDATADYALLALGGGGGTELLPLSWEPELHVRLDPALVSHYHETRRPDKESVELAAPKPSAKPSTNAASLSLNGVGACPVMIELTVAAHLCTPSGEQPPAPRPPQIIWLPGDRVEVQWKGKGFRGSWALADVTKASRKQVHVRFAEFVDECGLCLEEVLPRTRARLVPPPACATWRPVPGELVEARSNDLWWEGQVERFDSLKGYLFAHEQHRSWLWLPLEGMRPRPSHIQYYHRGRVARDSSSSSSDGGGGSDGEGDEEPRPPAHGSAEGAELCKPCEAGAPAAAPRKREKEFEKIPGRHRCPHAGCKLRERHAGLCQFGAEIGKRERKVRPQDGTMAQRVEVEEQQQLLMQIGRERRTAPKGFGRVAANEPRMPCRVIPGSRMAQWHPQLFAQTFSDQMATVLVFETARTPACCRGQLVLLGSHIVADVLHMLGAELAIDLVGKHVLCVPHAPAGSLGAALVELTARGLAEPVVRCLPNDTRVDLLVIDS